MAANGDVVEKKPADYIEDVEVTKEAKIAAQAEHETTLWEALKSNKKAAIWSAIISLTIIMEVHTKPHHDSRVPFLLTLCWMTGL